MEKIFWLIERERRWEDVERYSVVKMNGGVEERRWIESCRNGWNIMVC